MAKIRYVFYTVCETVPGTWIPHGLLQFGVEGEDCKTTLITYRRQGEEDFDISASVKVESGGAQKYQLAKTRQPSITGYPDIGFDIELELNAGASKFSGTLQWTDGKSAFVLSNWKGECVASFPDSTLMRPGLSTTPISERVKVFLAIVPWDKDYVDRALAGATDLFHRMMIDCLPERAQNWFFKNKKSFGNYLTSGSVNSQRCKYTSPREIRNNYERIFLVSGMHLLCRDLKDADWLDREFREGCQDRVQSYFDALKSSNASLGIQYRNAMNRCYFAAYTNWNNDWQEALRDPNGLLEDIKKAIHTVEFREYWITKFCDLDKTGFMPVEHWVSMIGDKLFLLKMAGNPNFNPYMQGYPREVEEILDEMLKLASEMGLRKSSLVKLHPSAINFKPGQVFSLKSREALDFSLAMDRARAASYGYNLVEFDIQSRLVHSFLRDNAQPLGLYKYKISIFWDFWFETSWSIEQG